MTHSHIPKGTDTEHLSAQGAKTLMWGAVAIVLVVVAILYLLAQIISPNVTGDPSKAEAQIVDNLKPVAGYSMGAASSGPKTGEEVFNSLCTACHATGAAGAPKVGDKAAWGPRIAQGYDTLFKHAIGGFTGKTGTMPAKGGGNNSDLEIGRAIVYMANQGGASFPEPKDPAAAAAEPAKK